MMGKEIGGLNQFRKPAKNALWHRFKLISDGEGYHCKVCDQPILGPTYICERADSQTYIHKSCAAQPLTRRRVHRFVNRHHIIFMEELDNQEKLVCLFCEELVSGSAYRCIYTKCNFLIHQSCIDIPMKLFKHPIDPEHNIFLLRLSEGKPCDLCGKLCVICYHCYPCDMAIHVKCASRGLMSVEKCHPHEFIMIPRGECQHTCQACGQQNSEIFYLCKNCRLWIHRSCFKTYLHTIKTKGCSHFLSYTFSRHGEHACKLCKELVDKRYAAYICDSCNYVVHLWCAYASLDSSDVDVTPLREDKTVSLWEIKNHFSHPEHNLILNEEHPEHDKYCMGCMDPIDSPPFYGCVPCQFFLHVKCAKLPRQIGLSFNPSRKYTLLREASFAGQRCFACKRTCTGFVYFHERFSSVMDVQCSLLQRHVKHEAHQHRLFFAFSKERSCDACSKEMDFYFRCVSCNFYLCWRCVTYPFHISCRYDEHLLNLTYKVEDDSREYYCLICEKERNHSHWFYYCLKCDFTAHLECAYSRK